jgi:hypothetical protein
MELVPLTRVVSSNPVHGEIYLILGQGLWFSTDTPASSTNKTGHHDIAEILLKVALNTKIQTHVEDIHVLIVTYVTIQTHGFRIKTFTYVCES